MTGVPQGILSAGDSVPINVGLRRMIQKRALYDKNVHSCRMGDRIAGGRNLLPHTGSGTWTSHCLIVQQLTLKPNIITNLLE